MEYQPNITLQGGIFAIPNAIVDKYLCLATATQLKTLLFLLRNPGQGRTAAEVARAIRIDQNEAADCLQYWVGENLLMQATTDEGVPEAIQSAQQTEKAPLPEAQTQLPTPAPIPAKPPISEQVSVAPTGQKVVKRGRIPFSSADVNRLSQKDCNIPLLLQETQQLLGRELSPNQTDMILYLYNDLGLSTHYIFTLVGYCVSIGKRNINYIERVAVNWVEQGIDTVDAAEMHISKLEKSRSNTELVKNTFGIFDRELSTNQKAMVDRWYEVLKMPIDMIKLSYDLTLDATGKMSFAYMDKILSRWQAEGIFTTSAAMEQATQRKGEVKKSDSSKPMTTPSYDMDKIKSRFQLGKIK